MTEVQQPATDLSPPTAGVPARQCSREPPPSHPPRTPRKRNRAAVHRFLCAPTPPLPHRPPTSSRGGPDGQAPPGLPRVVGSRPSQQPESKLERVFASCVEHLYITCPKCFTLLLCAPIDAQSFIEHPWDSHRAIVQQSAVFFFFSFLLSSTSRPALRSDHRPTQCSSQRFMYLRMHRTRQANKRTQPKTLS